MKYPFDVFMMKVEAHTFWVAKSKALKGCSAQADTPYEAIALLEEIEEEWIKTAQEIGIKVPEVSIVTGNELCFNKTYSGNFTVRISNKVHRLAAEMAKKENISLNQYVNDAIIEKNTFEKTSDILKELLSGTAEVKKNVICPYAKSKTFKYNSTSETIYSPIKQYCM